MQLTQKETLLLKDLKDQEQTCVEKYNKYAADASDGQLKGLFAQIGQIEQQHLDTINQIMASKYTTIWRKTGCTTEYKQMPKSERPRFWVFKIYSRIFREYNAFDR